MRIKYNLDGEYKYTDGVLVSKDISDCLKKETPTIPESRVVDFYLDGDHLYQHSLLLCVVSELFCEEHAFLEEGKVCINNKIPEWHRTLIPVSVLCLKDHIDLSAYGL